MTPTNIPTDRSTETMPNLWNDLGEIAEQIRRKLDAPANHASTPPTLREAAHVGTRLIVALHIIEGKTDIESTSITLHNNADDKETK